jgi:hypothetical protein
MDFNSADPPEVPQVLVEPILNLYRAGTPPLTISVSFNISLEAVMGLLARQQTDPSHARNFFHGLETKSQEFRCALSGKLMISPVVASDGKIYEQTALQTWLKTSKLSPVTGEPLSEAKPYPLHDLKAKVKEFSRSVLSQLEVCFKLRLEGEAALNLAADSLAVLLNDEGLMTCLESLTYLDTSQQKALIAAVIALVSRQTKTKMLMELVPLSGFSSSAICLLRKLLEDRPKGADFEDEFACLTELLGKPEPSYDLINLAFETSKFCDKDQLCQLQETLKRVCPTENLEFAELKLRSAELCVEDGDYDTARTTLTELTKDARLRRNLMEFYDRVGWRSEKRLFLEETFASSLGALVSEGASASMVESLENLLELTRICTLDPDKKHIKRYNGTRKGPQWNEHPERIYSYKFDTSELHWTTIETGTVESVNVPSHSFKAWISWVELPEGNLFIGGGTLSQAFTQGTTETYELNVTDYSVTPMPNMLTARWAHGTIYSEGKVYMISGYNGAHVKQCERFDCSTGNWEALPEIPSALRCVNAIEVETSRCIYILGGYNDAAYQDSVQELNLETLSWRTLSVRLQVNGYLIPTFKLQRDSSDVFYHQTGTIYKLDTSSQAISAVKTGVTVSQTEHFHNASYYSNGTLYCSRNVGAVMATVIGDF